MSRADVSEMRLLFSDLMATQTTRLRVGVVGKHDLMVTNNFPFASTVALPHFTKAQAYLFSIRD